MLCTFLRPRSQNLLELSLSVKPFGREIRIIIHHLQITLGLVDVLQSNVIPSLAQFQYICGPAFGIRDRQY